MSTDTDASLTAAQPLDRDVFRHVIGHFASGVTVITTRQDGKDFGMTASAVSSLSMDPPMLLVCINRRNPTQQAVSASRVFAVNILAREQEDVSRACASRRVEESRRLEGIPYHEEATGSPVLDHAIAFLDCRVEHDYDGGDHIIFVGRVEAAGARDGEPLVYFRGNYRSLATD